VTRGKRPESCHSRSFKNANELYEYIWIFPSEIGMSFDHIPFSNIPKPSTHPEQIIEHMATEEWIVGGVQKSAKIILQK
jgi:hypothetical protein